MQYTIGIDMGASAIKVAAAHGDDLLAPLILNRPAYAQAARDALFAYLRIAGLSREQVERVRLTGIGATRAQAPIIGIPVDVVNEFIANGMGATGLAGVASALVASVGTGTSFTSVEDGVCRHICGTALGGGTLSALSRTLLSIEDPQALQDLAARGTLANVDLCIRDVTDAPIPNLPPDVTVSNLARMRPDSLPEDIALGLYNMILQPVCTMAHLLSQGKFDCMLLIGTITRAPFVSGMVAMVEKLYGMRCIIPPHAEVATAIGAIRAPLA